VPVNRAASSRVEGTHAAETGPALAGRHDLVHGVVGERGEQAIHVAGVLGDRVANPEALDRAQLGGIEAATEPRAG
jgi:hypothetical protein